MNNFRERQNQNFFPITTSPTPPLSEKIPKYFSIVYGNWCIVVSCCVISCLLHIFLSSWSSFLLSFWVQLTVTKYTHARTLPQYWDFFSFSDAVFLPLLVYFLTCFMSLRRHPPSSQTPGHYWKSESTPLPSPRWWRNIRKIFRDPGLFIGNSRVHPSPLSIWNVSRLLVTYTYYEEIWGKYEGICRK